MEDTKRQYSQLESGIRLGNKSMCINLLEKPDFTQEERNVTISAVVPYILSLNHHLLYQKNVKKIKQNKKTNKKHAIPGWLNPERITSKKIQWDLFVDERMT